MGEEREEQRYGEYFVLDTAMIGGCWIISREMAAFIERELDRWPRRKWVKFVDVAGARVRLRAELIRSLRQSSADIRGEYRRFWKERDQESEEEKDWEEDF
jgi:hypothetical protein